MERITGRFLLAMFGIGVVLLIAGWAIGWQPGAKGRGPAASGGIILACWAVLQAWHSLRRSPPPPPDEPDDDETDPPHPPPRPVVIEGERPS